MGDQDNLAYPEDSVDLEFEDEDGEISGEISKESNARMSIAFYLLIIKRLLF